MAKTNLIIVGASGHAKVIIDVFEQMKDHEVLGLFDDNISEDTDVLGYRVLGKTNEIPSFLSRNADVKVFIAIGDNWTRSIVKDRLTNDMLEVQWAQAIHPFSHVGKGTTLGHGIAILAGAIINSDSQIGNFSIIGSNSNLDHEGQLGDFASLAPGSILGGNVQIGSFSAVGMGTNIVNGCQIGSHTVIGAGSTILEDFGDNLVVYGIPARKIKSRSKGESYL